MFKKLQRILRYFLINGAGMVCLYYFLTYNYFWAQNLTILFVGIHWVFSLLTLLGLWIICATRKELPETHKKIFDNLVKSKNESPIPRWFDLTFDLSYFVVLATFGHWWLTLFYFWGTFFQWVVRSMVDSYEKEQKII